jgi:hypothetical protein
MRDRWSTPKIKSTPKKDLFHDQSELDVECNGETYVPSRCERLDGWDTLAEETSVEGEVANEKYYIDLLVEHQVLLVRNGCEDRATFGLQGTAASPQDADNTTKSLESHH